MNEESKSIWKKSRNLPGSFLGWLILVTGIALFISLLGALIVDGMRWKEDWRAVAVIIVISVAGTSLFFFIRWLCCWRNFRRFLLGLAGLAVLIALFYAEEDWRGWHAWQKFKHEWEAKGERFDMASVIPPTVPNDQNFAMAPIWVESMKAVLGPKNSRSWFGNKFPDNGRTNFTDRLALDIVRNNDWGNEPTNGNWAKGTITDLKPWQTYYRTPAATNRDSTIETNEFSVALQPQSPAADVLLALGKYDSTIEELRQASLLPYSRFPLNYDDENPAEIMLPHLAALKRCAQVLEQRAVAELQNNQSEKALEDIKLTLRLTDSIRSEPLLISHLVRIAILQITLQPVYEGLAEHKLSDAQLAELDSELSKLDFLDDYKLAMHGEMGFQDGIIRYLRQHSGQYLNLIGDAGNYGHMSAAEFIVATTMHFHLVPSGWFYQNQLHCARAMEEFYLPVADVNQQTFMPALIQRADTAIESERKNLTPFNILECLMFPALSSAAKRFACAQSSTDLARVAIALERYRIAHGEYPESLDPLAPQFIAKLPHDIINGQPLHYRRDASGQFVLYSVGWNEKDDGGVVGLTEGGSLDTAKGDWVWRYPAK